MLLQIVLVVGVIAILGLQLWRMRTNPPAAAPIRLVSDHGSEVLLLAFIGAGCIGLLWRAIELGKTGELDVAAFLLVLQRVIEAVTSRWTSRSLDRMGQSLANAPPATPPAPGPDGTVAPPPAPKPSGQPDTLRAEMPAPDFEVRADSFRILDPSEQPLTGKPGMVDNEASRAAARAPVVDLSGQE